MRTTEHSHSCPAILIAQKCQPAILKGGVAEVAATHGAQDPYERHPRVFRQPGVGLQLVSDRPMQLQLLRSGLRVVRQMKKAHRVKAWRGYRTEEMNFRVGLTLNDSALVQVWPRGVWCELLRRMRTRSTRCSWHQQTFRIGGREAQGAPSTRRGLKRLVLHGLRW